jgi:hypothetical protein
VQPGVAGSIHLAHAARANRLEDLVGAEASFRSKPSGGQ